MDDPEFRWRKILIPAYGPSVLFGLGLGAVLPIIALTALDLGASHAAAGLIVALVGLGSLVSNLPAAILTNRFGERRALMGAASCCVLAMAVALVSGSPLLLALGILLLGMATSVFYLARQSYLMDAVPLNLRARAFSTLGGTQRMGMFIGPFLAAGAMHWLGLAGAYWIAILAFVAAGALAWAIPDPGTTGTQAGDGTPASASASDSGSGMASEAGAGAGSGPAAKAGNQPGLWPVAVAHRHVLLTLGVGILLIGALRASRQIAIPLWAEHIGLSPATTALIYGLTSGIDMLVFYPAGKIMDEYGRLWVALPCTLILGLAFALLPLTHTATTLVIVCIIMGFGNGIGSGIVMTLGADSAPQSGRNQFLGLWRLISDVGTSAGPFVLSAMTAAISLAAGIGTMGILGVVAAGIFWHKLRPQPKQSI